MSELNEKVQKTINNDEPYYEKEFDLFEELSEILKPQI